MEKKQIDPRAYLLRHPDQTQYQQVGKGKPVIKRINGLKVYMDQVLGQGMTATVHLGKYVVKDNNGKTTKINCAVKVIKSNLVNDSNF